jgi:hypothetical protein
MNKYYILGLFLVGSLSAEKIGHVEYRLPSNNWEMFNEMNDQRGVTRIYAPANSANENHQFFSAHANGMAPPKEVSEESLKQSLQPMFPGQQLTIKILGKDGNSIMYRWDTDAIHGITRVFASSDGTTMLSYHTENPEHLQGKFLDHMKSTLQDAHFR